MTPTAEMESSRKSPSAASTSSTSSSNSNSAGEPTADRKAARKASETAKSRKRSTRRVTTVEDEKDAKGRAKRKRTSTESPTKSEESDDAVSDNMPPGSPKSNNAQRPTADLKSPLRVSPRKASSVYDFRDDPAAVEDAAKRNESTVVVNGVDSMDVPKAATSVIQVNMSSVKTEDAVEEDKENVSDPGDVPPKEADPKIDDTVCFESTNEKGQATFKRHWNRGEHNSCARTDLEFRVKPGCQWARKSDERKTARVNGHPPTTVIKQEPNTSRHDAHSSSLAQLSPVVSRPPTIMSSAPMGGMPPHLGSPHMPPAHMLHPSFLGAAINGLNQNQMQNAFPSNLTAGARLQQYAEQVQQAGVTFQAQQAYSMGDMNTYHRLMMYQQEQQRMEQHMQREREMQMAMQQQQQQMQQQAQQVIVVFHLLFLSRHYIPFFLRRTIN
jgi:hypothetical protein